jgi:putative hydrolase of the HAD superfamily
MLLDLDNTLYPRERGVFDRISTLIDSYVQDVSGLPAGRARELRQSYIDTYGTTLGGLIRHHGVEPEHYMDHVHQVPVEKLLDTDPGLDAILAAIDLPKVIFTNATSRHARRVLSALGVSAHFDHICDLASTGYAGKPDPGSYRTASRMLGFDPGAIMFADDRIENLEPAARLGMTTILVGGGGSENSHHQVSDMAGLAGMIKGASWFRG